MIKIKKFLIILISITGFMMANDAENKTKAHSILDKIALEAQIDPDILQVRCLLLMGE